ncbi:alpha/beta fold hydrolase [Streptomyces evansiae]|uniref:alpha/beta fold hydrolase n=1 Tax=Streptomyces evansiae TaxID=3075535 RepID=UPI00288385A7|nr:alpha/beta hydrolase [Streptomyces sp. DSM 41859]MDT0424852.1 alpha/beta hydrolase [Streptomyces sp. DSM 41859]
MRQVTLSAGEIEYDETGSGPPVVLLHGLLMNHTLWDEVLPLLPGGFRYVRPVLPLGAHRLPMRPDADLGMAGMGRLLAEFLEKLDLTGVTLVHTDWGGGLFLTALGLHERVARQVILPCEAFDNVPPGLPGRMVVLASRLPGGLALAARQLRVPALRNSPLMLGPMTKRPLPDALVRGWTEPLLRDAGVRRDLAAYCTAPLDKARLVRDTEALRDFTGETLVLWAPENKLMPLAHGKRLAALLPAGRYAEIPDAGVLAMIDRPEEVAGELSAFLVGAGS